MRRRTRNVLLAGVAALVVSSGAAVVAWASVADAEVVHACYVKSSGAVRIVDAATACRTGEAALEWNVQGPPGQSGGGAAGFTTVFAPTSVPTANVSTPPLVILSGLPFGPSFATVSMTVSNGSGQAVTLICAVGEAGPAYTFDVPGNPGGPGPTSTTVSFVGRSSSTGVPFGCHIWGDPAQPIQNVTVAGTIQAIALSSLTVQEP